MADGPDSARRTPPTTGSDDVLTRLGLTGPGANAAAGGRAARRRAAEEAEEEAERRQADAPEAAGRGRTGVGGPDAPRPPLRPPRADADRPIPRDLPTRVFPLATGDQPPRGTSPPGPRRTAPGGTRPAGAPNARPPYSDARPRNTTASPPHGAPRNGQRAERPRPPSDAGPLRPDAAHNRQRAEPAVTPRPPSDAGPLRPDAAHNGLRAEPAGTPRPPTSYGAPGDDALRAEPAVTPRPPTRDGALGHAAHNRPRAEPPVTPRPPSRDGALGNDAGRTGPRADVARASRPPSSEGPRGNDKARTGRRAEPASPNGTASEARRIDETLTRLSLAHAGLAADGSPAEPAEEQDDRPPRRRPSLLRLAALAVAATVIAAGGVGWGAQRWLGSAVRAAGALDPGSGAIVDPANQAGAENVLVVATDRAATPGAAARPDTVVVAHLPGGAASGTAKLTVLSIPTDLEVSRPPCERYDAASATYTADTVPAQARTQLASALDLGGPRCATRAVQQLTGLAITRYVGIDLDRLGAAVDAVSGVRVCTPRAVVDASLGPVAPTPGSISLDARRATDYASAAAVVGDPPAGQGRIERQQQVLAAVLGSGLSDMGLLDLRQVRALRPALGDALATDGADLDQVLALARSMHDLGAAGVTFATVPTDPDPAGGSVLRATDAGAVFDAVRTDAALPATTGGQQSGLKPSDLLVQVRNASQRPGLAAKIADTLRGLGFGVGAVTNADQPTPQTLIRYSPDQTGAAQLLAATVPAATTVPDPGATGVLQLVLGGSFDGVVRAPTSAPAEQAAGPSPIAVTCP